MDAAEHVLNELARSRAEELGRGDLEHAVLLPPSLDSPFLTVTESMGQEIPSVVLKVLMVVEADARAFDWWKKEVLENERTRLEEEFSRRLQGSLQTRGDLLLDPGMERLDQPVVLPLPVSRSPDEGLVRLEVTEFLDAELLLENEPRLERHPVQFHYLVRPYVAWPALREIILSERDQRRHWQEFCENNRLPRKIAQNARCFVHFTQEALFSDNDLFLTTGWRWKLASGGGSTLLGSWRGLSAWRGGNGPAR